MGPGGSRPTARGRDEDWQRAASRPTPKGWGGVARRGARSLEFPPDKAWADEHDHHPGPPAEWEPEDWRRGAGHRRGAGDRACSRPAQRPPQASASATGSRGDRAGGGEAGCGQGHGSDGGGGRRLRAGPSPGRAADGASAVRDAPDVASVRELAGLASYRLGRWAEAARHLKASREATGSVEHDAVLADCYRALGRFGKVDALWEELRAVSPAPALMAEGRIVAAGAMADRGDVRGAIRLLERGPLEPRRGPRAVPPAPLVRPGRPLRTG